MTAENYEASSQTESALLQQALQQVKELTQKLEQLQENHKRLEQENSNLKHRLQLRLNEQMQVETSNTPLPTATKHTPEPNHTISTPLLVKEPSVDMVSPPTPTQLTASTGPPIQSLTPEEKITLFRKLFFSRLDVHALRWESATSAKTGYSPALDHNGRAHTYDPKRKKRICLEGCPNLPVTAEVVKHHLQGKHVIGTYPLTRDDTCIFLALDLDEGNWQEEASALATAADTFGIKAYIERSRSGNGGHIWIFFDSPVPAGQARKLVVR